MRVQPHLIRNGILGEISEFLGFLGITTVERAGDQHG
jgi:hypothetical protein